MSDSDIPSKERGNEEAGAPHNGMHGSLHFCMVTSFYPPHNFGGDGIFVQRLANSLARRGHRVTVIYCVDAYHTSGGDPVEEPSGGDANITVHALQSRARALSSLITHQFAVPGLKRWALKEIFDANDFDVIHFHNISLIGGPGILDYGAGLKLYTAHEYWLLCPLSTLWKFGAEPCTTRNCVRCTLSAGRPPQWWRFTGYLERKLQQLDALLAPSEFSIRKHREMGMQVDFVHMPNFLPASESHAAQGKAQDPSARPFFLMVGRLEKSKGFQKIVSFFQSYQEADLIVVGKGEYEQELRELASGHSNIQLAGHLPYEELQQYYADARALIVPSIWFEPFGLVVLEAFAQGTPAIVNRAGALPELIERSEGGLVYETDAELRSALDQLRASQEVAAELGVNGYNSYREYWSEEAHLSRYLGLIAGLQQRQGR